MISTKNEQQYYNIYRSYTDLISQAYNFFKKIEHFSREFNREKMISSGQSLAMSSVTGFLSDNKLRAIKKIIRLCRDENIDFEKIAFKDQVEIVIFYYFPFLAVDSEDDNFLEVKNDMSLKVRDTIFKKALKDSGGDRDKFCGIIKRVNNINKCFTVEASVSDLKEFFEKDTRYSSYNKQCVILSNFLNDVILSEDISTELVCNVYLSGLRESKRELKYHNSRQIFSEVADFAYDKERQQDTLKV